MLLNSMSWAKMGKVDLSRFVTFIFTIILLGSRGGQGQNIAPKVILYDQKGSVGETRVFTGLSIPNLAQFAYDNRAQSVCVTGTWTFFEFPWFNQGPWSGGMEYIYGVNHYCMNLAILGGKVSSIRFVGSPSDYRTPSISLYDTTYFQGREELIFYDRNVLYLGGQVKSLIVTGGPSQGWTLYDQPHFGGHSVCVFPKGSNIPWEPYFLPDTALINIPHGAIRSVRIGCFSQTRFGGKEDEEGSRSKSSMTFNSTSIGDNSSSMSLRNLYARNV